MLDILKHDLHKVKTPNYEPHKEALKNETMKKVDSVASMISRNWRKFEIEKSSPYRISLIESLNKEITRNERIFIQRELNNLFQELDPVKLHNLILNSQVLNKFSESQNYPYTSLKYHLLLSCAFYFNLSNGNKWTQLYLTEKTQKISDYQIIFKNKDREWALVPDSGMSRVYSKFYMTWDRRIRFDFGGEHQVLNHILSRIGSWSAVLALMEEFMNK